MPAQLPLVIAVLMLVHPAGLASQPVQLLPGVPTAGQAKTPSVATKPSDYGAWCSVLKAAIAHHPEDKSLLEGMALRAPSPDVSKLARILLDEWYLNHNDPRLTVPFPLEGAFFFPVGALKKAEEVKYPLVVAIGEVGTDGFVVEASVAKSSGKELVDELCLEHFRKTRYRPAWKGQGFVSQEYAYTCHIRLEP